MVKIVLDDSAGKACIEQHRNAFRVLGRVLRDLANGKDVYTIGRGGEKIVVARENMRNTIAKGYYAKLRELDDKSSLPCLLPEDIHEVVSEVRKYEASHNNKGLKRAKQILAMIYSYERFSKGMSPQYKDGVLSWESNQNGWGAWKFIRMLGIRSCVYCNAETIFSLLMTNKLPGSAKEPKYYSATHKRSALDHFYSHSKYPFLGITLSNLVPACTRCNTNVKGAKALDPGKHLYPYRDSFHSGARFAIAYKSCGCIMNMDESDIHIAILSKDDSGISKRALKSAEFFHLPEVYNQLHKRDALTVLHRTTALPQSYRDFLAHKYPGIKEMVLDYVCRGSSLDSSKIHSHNLSKLTIDIERQFGNGNKS